MSNPIDSDHTAAARDPHSSAATSLPAGTAALRFGPPSVDGEVGTLGPYRVLKQLGAGGMGAVYLALDPRLDRKLALKVMLPEFDADADAKERFVREARAAAKISHDNVVTVFEADERDGVSYIAMQFLQGYPLDEFLKKQGAPALPHVIRIARETALGLSAAHALGLVHRDIKPANLWLEAPNGRVKVLDFGLAKPIGSETELTRSGAVMGTPAYMSPEQARSARVDHRTDLFSLGAVLYRLCTGKTPFSGPNVMAVLMALGSDDPTPVRELNPNVPESLAALIHQLLAKKPEDRPQTAAEVAKRLRAILEQLAAPAMSPVAEPFVPMATPADISTSQPVVVHPLPLQPPLVAPMQITAQPEIAFADLGPDDATQADPTTDSPKPMQKKSGKKGILIAAAVAALLAVVASAIVIKSKNKDGAETETKVPDGATVPVVTSGKPVAKVEPDPAKSGDPLTAAYKNSLGMEFVKVPKGTGWLGGGGGKSGETKVEVKQDFYLGKYEVTQEEWEKVMEKNPSTFKRGKASVKDIGDADLKRFPVENVSWDDCQLFIKKVNEREKESGWVYRLPNEAEWEYACRGGAVDKLDSAFDFYFAKPTNMLLPDQANFAPGEGMGLQQTCKVGSYGPNALGLHDMHGSVWEWCEDAVTAVGGASHRAYRGGGWIHDSRLCRAASRVAFSPSDRSSYLGLRLARVPVGMETVKVAPEEKKVPPVVEGKLTPVFKNSSGMEFVIVPKGKSWRGGSGGKPGSQEVEIKEEFYLGKYEVTQEEWEKVTGKTPSHFSRTGPGKAAVVDIGDADLKRFPVEGVSWDDCQLFLEQLNKREKETGWVYRLPKEAEWEYACRGGPVDKLTSAFDFYFAKPTNTLLPEQANFDYPKALRRPCKVGSYEPNVLGLHDMHGSVWEWCDDERAGDDSRRAGRGGSWHDDSGVGWAAVRNTNPQSYRNNSLGLRVARVPVGKEGQVK